MTATGYALLPDRGVLALRGPDARVFLQGLISANVNRISADQAGYGALLTPQGKFLFDFFVVQADDALMLETERGRLADLQRRLMMYRLRSAVEIVDESERFTVAVLLGDDVAVRLDLPERRGACRALDRGLVWIDPRLARLGARALLPRSTAQATLAGLGFGALDFEAYERLRIAQGVGDGSRDLMVEKATLLENGFGELGGVDFDKGCFIGQELTARMRYRGLVRRRLMPVRFEGERPEPGTIVRLGEREAGEMRSSIAGHGLALLRLDRIAEAREAGTPLLAGDTEVVPLKPDWANF